VLDSSESSSKDEDFDATVEEDLFTVGDLEYEDEDTSSGDGERRYLRAYYNDRRQGRRRPGRTPGRRPGNEKQRINGQLGTTPHRPDFSNTGGNTAGLFTAPQLPYCPNFSMHSTGMGPCMATQTQIPGINACPSGTLGQSVNGPCVVW